MKIRIHFAVGSTAMRNDFETREGFVKICDVIERTAKGDGAVRFVAQGCSVAIAAKSIVLVEELPS